MTTERRYDPKTVEPKWQALWERERTWEVSNDAAAGADAFYVAEMLPYPSGEPHMGHLKNYSVGDAVAHFQRRIGRRVLHPIGYDAFGLPAENHAIKSGEHPRDSTAEVDRAFQREFQLVGRVVRLVARAGHQRADATTAGRSGSSSSSTSAGSPTAPRRPSTGARRTRPCSPTSRSSTAAASAAARRSRRASSSSGSSASPTTPTACSTTSRPSSGRRTSCACSRTGSGAPRAPRCSSARPRWASTTPSSPRARTRCSARRSS